jgi:hypothetical protein
LFYLIKLETKMSQVAKNRWTFSSCSYGAAAAGLVTALLCAAGGAYATNYSLWVNGRSNDSAVKGSYTDFIYWGPSGTAAGVNKKSVNWDGYNKISTQNYRIRDALDCYLHG